MPPTRTTRPVRATRIGQLTRAYRQNTPIFIACVRPSILSLPPLRPLSHTTQVTNTDWTSLLDITLPAPIATWYHTSQSISTSSIIHSSSTQHHWQQIEKSAAEIEALLVADLDPSTTCL
jgi:hypothetical protein